MILQKEFYFVRHGQTDYNILEGKQKQDHPKDVPLNETGRNQARTIESIISLLPIVTVCSSPLTRAQETQEIITSKLQAAHCEIDNLGECQAQIWREMVRLGMYSALPNEGIVHQFIQRVRNGINQALSLPGPTLIVAQGGVHWALCCLMAIEELSGQLTTACPSIFDN